MTIEDQFRNIVSEAITPLVEEIKTLRSQINQREYPPVIRVDQMAEIMQIGITRAYEIAGDPNFPAAIRDGRKIRIITDRLFDYLSNEARKIG